MPVPIVSILLLVWNNHEHLPTCLNALQAQTFQDFEIVLVENGSANPGDLKDVRTNHPAFNIVIERQKTNVGFAAGNNIGARLATGKWLALLNVDAFPQPDWLESLLRAADEHPQVGAFTSRQVQFHAPHLLDGAGDSYHITGLAWRRFYNRSVQEYGLEGGEVFSACPAAAMYLREEFMRAEGFDEDYFSYFEDVDLGFRLRLQGQKCLYVPAAIVHHVGSASTGKRSDFSVHYGYRNMIWTFFKNMPSPLLWVFLPLHVFTVLFFMGYLSLRGQGGAIGRAVVDAMRGLPAVLEKRKNIQRGRKVSSWELLRVMSTGLLEPYLEFIRRNKSQ
jgi:GT2 family glycosyltransferase